MGQHSLCYQQWVDRRLCKDEIDSKRRRSNGRSILWTYVHSTIPSARWHKFDLEFAKRVAIRPLRGRRVCGNFRSSIPRSFTVQKFRLQLLSSALRRSDYGIVRETFTSEEVARSDILFWGIHYTSYEWATHICHSVHRQSQYGQVKTAFQSFLRSCKRSFRPVIHWKHRRKAHFRHVWCFLRHINKTCRLRWRHWRHPPCTVYSEAKPAGKIRKVQIHQWNGERSWRFRGECSDDDARKNAQVCQRL